MVVEECVCVCACVCAWQVALQQYHWHHCDNTHEMCEHWISDGRTCIFAWERLAEVVIGP